MLVVERRRQAVGGPFGAKSPTGVSLPALAGDVLLAFIALAIVGLVLAEKHRTRAHPVALSPVAE
jgi:hypothetical protein